MTREIALEYRFEKHAGGSPVPCEQCTTSQGPWHIRVYFDGRTLVSCYCSDCAQDIATAIKTKAIEPALVA